MSIFKQRVNETSSIIPSGFTGYIVRNSNVIIENSYVYKGTSFVNAFDNSNVLIKDCGTPIPPVESSLNLYTKLHKKVNDEIDKRLLPQWIHYKFNVKNDNNDTNWENYSCSKNGELKVNIVYGNELSESEILSSMIDYRNNIRNNENTKIPLSATFEEQIINDRKG